VQQNRSRYADYDRVLTDVQKTFHHLCDVFVMLCRRYPCGHDEKVIWTAQLSVLHGMQAASTLEKHHAANVVSNVQKMREAWANSDTQGI
jgi:hypothetical protein